MDSIDKKIDKEPSVSVVLGLPFHSVSLSEAIEECARCMNQAEPRYIVTPNLDFTYQAYQSNELRSILFHAYRVFCDGKPIVWLSKLFGGTLKERIAGADLLAPLLEWCSQNGKSVYLMGSTLPILESATKKALQLNPNLKIYGYTSPPMAPIEEWDNANIIKKIKEKKPDLLLLFLGCPKQELWINKYYQECGVPLSIGLGASLNFFSGKQKRAPKLFQKIGLEWLWRVFLEPRRLYERYSRNIVFILWAMFKQLAIVLGHRKSKHCSTKNTTSNQAIKESGLKPQKQESLPENTGYTFLSWEGSIDISSIDTLEQVRDFNRPIVLNLSAVTFIDSSGMGAICAIARKLKSNQHSLFLINPSSIVRQSLQLTHLDRIIPIFESIEDIEAHIKNEMDMATNASK